jgi:hypothetical protein
MIKNIMIINKIRFFSTRVYVHICIYRERRIYVHKTHTHLLDGSGEIGQCLGVDGEEGQGGAEQCFTALKQ